jgi:hypothetical protein
MSESTKGSALDRFEIAAVVVLALATLATAWSGYQATRWGQESTLAQRESNSARIKATRASDLANAQTVIDVSVFEQWVDAYAHNDTFLADFYFARFRDEFKPAVEAWIATRPLQNPDAPLTPFVMPEYVLAARQEAEQQDEITAAASARVEPNLQRQANYVLCVVLFAMVLFLAGVSGRTSNRMLRLIILGFGCVLFIGTIVWIATFPVSVSV